LWQWGCYWRKTQFHSENALYLRPSVADLPLKIENASVRVMQQASYSPALTTSASKKYRENRD
jgi:hypothetical protein